ncbi:hypothetical protein J8F10_19380 [Gemmata sp. G18]|uniref:Uncharacterized protein n=1 Tax=Gemmata palustris TaxID=2822762 RepID=A0ABS5BUL6_9BACT|nr:hypothetical protein [Gemmata palustris]MBP3957414.1 hypothetical protein [Gemmata palustris]
MGLPETLVAKLTNSPVNALVGGRITPAIGTDGTQVPFVAFTITSSENSYRLDGSPSSLEKTGIMFDVWGNKHTQVTQILSALRSTLSGWSEGQVKWSMWGNSATEKDEDSERYSAVSEFTVWYEQTVRIRVDAGIESGEAFGTPTITGDAPRLDFSEPFNSQYLAVF